MLTTLLCYKTVIKFFVEMQQYTLSIFTEKWLILGTVFISARDQNWTISRFFLQHRSVVVSATLPPAACWWCVALSGCSVWRQGRTARRHSPQGPEDSECSQTGVQLVRAHDCWSDTPHDPSAEPHHCCPHTAALPAPYNTVPYFCYSSVQCTSMY